MLRRTFKCIYVSDRGWFGVFLLVFRCGDGKGHAVSAKPKLVSQLTRSNFLFLCLKPKKTNSLRHWNTFTHKYIQPPKTCKEDGVHINTDPKTSLCVNQAKHTHPLKTQSKRSHSPLPSKNLSMCHRSGVDILSLSNSTLRTHGNMSSLKFWPVKDSTSNRSIHLSIKHTLSSRLLPIRNLKNGLYFSRDLLCLFGISARHFSKQTFILILTWVLNDSSEWSGISHCVVRQRQSNDFDMSKKIK